jgi:hypothetical protein
LKQTELISKTLPIQPWFQDHCFNGRVILAAVEAMRLLASSVQERHPEYNARVIEQGNFAKFLEIPPGQREIDILIELQTEETGDLCAKLLTRKQLKNMARMTEHCELHFRIGRSSADTEADLARQCSGDAVFEVSAEQIYSELVPFGPAYRSLQGMLSCGKEHAQGILRAPDLPLAASDRALTGSPFPLDGAMHAACVHGQSLIDCVPFPVGFSKRIIDNPTLPGENYLACVVLQSLSADELSYDIQIIDETGALRETVRNLRMRDVSGGRIKPPGWIKSLYSKKR